MIDCFIIFNLYLIIGINYNKKIFFFILLLTIFYFIVHINHSILYILNFSILFNLLLSILYIYIWKNHLNYIFNSSESHKYSSPIPINITSNSFLNLVHSWASSEIKILYYGIMMEIMPYFNSKNNPLLNPSKIYTIKMYY